MWNEIFKRQKGKDVRDYRNTIKRTITLNDYVTIDYQKHYEETKDED